MVVVDFCFGSNKPSTSATTFVVGFTGQRARHHRGNACSQSPALKNCGSHSALCKNLIAATSGAPVRSA
jgi:hypothetical protein